MNHGLQNQNPRAALRGFVYPIQTTWQLYDVSGLKGLLFRVRTVVGIGPCGVTDRTV